MTKGIPNPRNARLGNATVEAKRVLLMVKSWPKTRMHLEGWLQLKYALSPPTIRDYIKLVQLRLTIDPETRMFMDQTGIGNSKNMHPAVEFKKASEYTDAVQSLGHEGGC